MENEKSTFLEFILYNNWANQKVLEACQNLTEEQLNATIPGAYGTIRDTCIHPNYKSRHRAPHEYHHDA
jgi:uncharacterized damage-inducible protein DinB